MVSSFNVHTDVMSGPRIASSNIIVNAALDVLKEYGDTKKVKIIAGGDFNTLPDTPQDQSTAKQLSILEDAKFNGKPLFYEATKHLKFDDGTTANNTFIPFPYDPIVNNRGVNKANEWYTINDIDERRNNINKFYIDESQALGGFLDRIFLWGCTAFDVRVIMKGSFGSLFGYDEENVKRYIVNNIKNGPAFSSDHMGVLCILGD